jgi:hypothetical protein
VNEREICHAAVELTDPAERSAYLERVCAGNSSLQRHLQDMLQVYPELGTFLECSAVDVEGAGGPGTPVGDQQFANRRHFFAAGAEAMRRTLIDRARARWVALDGVAAPEPKERLLALDEALTQLAGADSVAARVVEMHHFAGMSHEQVATALNVSVYRARQKWTFARAWLKTTLGEF